MTFYFFISFYFFSTLSSLSNEKKRKHSFALFILSVRALHSKESATVTANSRSQMMNYFVALFSPEMARTDSQFERVNKITGEMKGERMRDSIYRDFGLIQQDAGLTSIEAFTGAQHECRAAIKPINRNPNSLSLAFICRNYRADHNRCRQVSLVRF